MERPTYDMTFLVDVPAFYKMNLFDRVAQKARVLVIALDHGGYRPDDFYSAGNGSYDVRYLSAKKNGGKIRELKKILRGVSCPVLVIDGWADRPMQYATLFARIKKKCLIVESTVYESSAAGLTGLVKKRLLASIDTALVPGELGARLVRRLGFGGAVSKTHGVGLYNRGQCPAFVPKEQVTRFLFVGRLVPVKNLPCLIRVFNELPALSLDIVGFGPLEQELKAIAKSNVHFLGKKDNGELPAIYREHDAFILPSISETWGVVVEEAMSNGLPVAVTCRAGCVGDLVFDGQNGVVFDPASEQDIATAVRRLCDVSFYNALRRNVCAIDFARIEQSQVQVYLDCMA